MFFWREQAYLICIAKHLCLVITRDVPPQMMNTVGHWRGRSTTSKDNWPTVSPAEAREVGDVEVKIGVLEEYVRSIEASLPVPVLIRHTT